MARLGGVGVLVGRVDWVVVGPPRCREGRGMDWMVVVSAGAVVGAIVLVGVVRQVPAKVVAWCLAQVLR